MSNLLAQTSASFIEWLAPALMVAGLVMLALIALLMFRGQRSWETQQPAQAADERLASLDSGIGDVQQQLGALAARLGEIEDELHNMSFDREHRRAVGPSVLHAPAAIEKKACASPDALTQQIHELHDAGHDAVDIARRLEAPIGNVELVLALRAIRADAGA